MLPASLAGGVLGVLASGGMVSLGSIAGFLAVLGIAARHSVFLISHYQRLEGGAGLPFGLELVLRGARESLLPVLTSSAAIVAALLPIVVLGRIAGLEIVQPTALVVIGGVVASALATQFVLPALYLMVGSGAARRSDIGLAAGV
jgi:Cu/Ag efflux pump CusA